jgi:2-keto-4-pentenoate hydratase/2-oxohepta-3-ene-1,7-dioic acid hydratase in catechol pathway
MSLSNVRLNPPLACTRSAVLALKHFPFARRSRQRAKPLPMQRCCRPDLSLPANYPLRSVTLLAPVNHLGKIIAVGLNYRDHAIETTLEITTSPLIFAKFPSSINGPDSEVVIPADDAQVDYEAELAAVIGRRAKAVPEAAALDYVAGYMPLNDVSCPAMALCRQVMGSRKILRRVLSHRSVAYHRRCSRRSTRARDSHAV